MSEYQAIKKKCAKQIEALCRDTMLDILNVIRRRELQLVATKDPLERMGQLMQIKEYRGMYRDLRASYQDAHRIAVGA